MCLKIRCDGKSEKFYKIFSELDKVLQHSTAHGSEYSTCPGGGNPARKRQRISHQWR